MFDPKILDDLSRKLVDSLPAGARALQSDMQSNFRSILQGALARMDLVTREEFDAQTEVLARTRARYEELARRVAELEERSGKGDSPP